MSKQKEKKLTGEISPAQYRDSLTNVELLEIYLVKSTVEINKDLLSADSIPSIDIKDKFKFLNGKKETNISVEYKLKAFDKNKKTDILNISAEYTVLLQTKENLSDEFWEIYQKATLPLIIWPYLREYIQSTTSRMNIPPLTLPMLIR
jgi:preprotein translocase subunit SecB